MTVPETGDMQSGNFSEGELIQWKWLWQKGWRCFRESDARQNFTLKKYSKVFHDDENSEDKILEVDPTWKQSMAICKGIEKMLTLHYKLYNEMKGARLFKLLFYIWC